MRRKQHQGIRDAIESYQMAELTLQAEKEKLITAVLDCGQRAVMLPDQGLVVRVHGDDPGSSVESGDYRYVVISEAMPLPTPRRRNAAKRTAEETAG